jgi:hypothetical protein
MGGPLPVGGVLRRSGPSVKVLNRERQRGGPGLAENTHNTAT